ncbi:hypothetical protein DV738_g5597, partial [Chaetothyriales sp. CBS 135597]
MASQQQPPPPLPAAQHRPPYPPPNPTLRADHRASPINPQPAGMLFSSPPPQSFSPQFGQPPAAKRPRLSPDVASPFHTPSHPQQVAGQTASPAGAVSFNRSQVQPGPGSMPPPQRPVEREREGEQADGFENEIMRSSGVDLDQEDQNVAASNIYPGASFRGQPALVGNASAPGPAAVGYVGQQPNGGEVAAEPLREPDPAERQERLEARADWEASRHRQFPLWDMFLYGGPLNDRIREKSQQERLQDPQAGVLVNTQRTGPPPRARVNGFEGATREIDKGQAILDSGAKGERLREIMSIISLATKTRLTGILNASGRLAMERRQHSKGQIPAEWADIGLAAGVQASTGTNDGSSGRAGPADLATGAHSQANGGSWTAAAGTDTVAATFQKLAQTERADEEARRAKRAKRKSGATGTATDTAGKPDVAAMEAAVAAESTQKMTKKAQKEIAGRAAEQVAHASANEAARMAISGMMGSRFGSKKNRTYDWLTTGKSGSSTPTRVPSMTAGSVVGTPSAPRAQAPARENKVGPWDEDKEPGIQVRDVLLVLESDGRAPKTYLKALEKIKD